ncbi:testis-expressed protein 15 [Elgaria multicarinata webbii]|uniref:testis-expressed protein 15 n=1 Tax=Elgaria multicarinata webbii TaxID=159646 RepID=UPI002FCCCC86
MGRKPTRYVHQVEDKIEMEPKIEAIRKNIALATRGLFLPEQNSLKHFTIPKRTPDKGLLTECSINQRDYSEIKQRLSQSCLDTQCKLECLWQFEKIEILHNKFLEEEFVAKRSKLREEGRQDEEFSSFLVVSKDEVSKICQKGLHIGHSKKERNIMKELGNPQLGVYLFRYVDIALSYASTHSIPVENIIIFRVLFGKVKKIQPPKGKKKVVLDPTPNFDCHISRNHPSLQDSLEDQAIGSLVYFYEYNELSKPVDKPRQCLPYAVIKVKSVNKNVMADYPVTSLKLCKPKRLPKHVGRGRGLPLENCTRVTRIGKSKLIYEHFRKPVECCAVNSDNITSAEISSFSGSIQNWNSSVAETQCKKNKHKSTRRWDSAQMEANEVNIQHILGEDVKSCHMGNSTKNPLKTFTGISPVCNSGSSTVTTSRLIKDPRLTKREKNLGKQSEEAIFHGSSQNEKELEISANVSIPYPVPKGFFLHDSKHEFSQRQYVEKTSRKESTSEEHVSPSPLNRDEDYKENNEQLLGNINKEILPYNTYMEHFLKTYVSYSSSKSKDFKNNSSTILVEDLKREKGMNYSEVKLANEWKSLDSQPVSITVDYRKEKPIIEPPFYDHTDISICKQNHESVTSGKDKMDHRGEMGSHLQEVYGCTSEIDCSTDFDQKCVINNCTSSEREGNDVGKTYCVQDHTLHSGFCKKVHASENMREVWTENNYGFEWSSDEMRANNFEQNKPQETIQSQKSSVERANNSIYKKEEYTINKGKGSPIKERISDIHNMHYSHDTSRTDLVMRDFSEKNMCVSKLESLDKNIFRDRECSSLGIFVDGQRDHETYIEGADGFDQIHTAQLEGSLGEEKSREYTPEIQIFCATENAAEKTSGSQQNYVEKGLKSIDDINCMKISEYTDTLVSESSACALNLNFQRCSLSETQVMNIESGKEKFEDLHEQALLTKSVGLTTHQEKNHIDFILHTSVPLGNIEHTEIKKPQSEHTDSPNANFEMLNNNFSCRDSISEGLEVKCEDTNIQDLEITNEFESALEWCKKCLLVPQKLCSHGNTSSEEGEYHYLQKRMDWDNLFGKPSLKIEVSGNSFMKLNENWEKSGVEDKETESFHTFRCPDLRITVNNKFQSKLKAKREKCPAKYSRHKMGIKCMQKKKMKKCTQSQKKTKLCHKKKEFNIQHSSKMCSSLSKGQFKKIVQSEKHIKNILNTLNTEAQLCKNKCVSQKIGGAMFHLRKARRRVRALKAVAEVGSKSPRDSSKSYKVLRCRLLHVDSSIASRCISDMSSSNDNMRNIKKELGTVSEKPTNLDMELKNNFSSEANNCTSKNIAKHLNSTTEEKELEVCQTGERKGECTCKCDVMMSTVKFATPVQTALESSAKKLKPDDISILSPIYTMQENVFSNKKEILGKKPAQQDNINKRIGVGRCSASSAFLPIAEDKHDVRVSQIYLNSQMHGAESLSLKTRSNNSSNTNLEGNCSEMLTEYFNKQQEDSHNKNNNLKSEPYCPNKLGQAAEQELHTAENRKYKPLTAYVRQPENNTEGVLSSEFHPVPSIDNNLLLSSHHYALQELEGGKIEETGILKIKKEFSNIKPNVKNNIPVQPFVKIGFEQKDMTQTSHITPSEESICKQSSSNTNQVIRLHSDSLLRTVSEQGVEAITATTILSPACYNVMPNKATKNFTTSWTRPNENCFSSEHSNNCKDLSSDIKCTKVEMEPKPLDFKIKISEILQQADETSSLNILHEKIIFCRSSLPLFVMAFEKKQGCSLEQVLVSREILGNGERNMQASCKLKPCAIEALVELQIIMETIEFIENKKRLIEGEPTFRSLLWYDDSLHSELFGGQSGYQQQSNFYPAFQRRLKYSAHNELQSYHKQLVEVFESTRGENNSYYSFLKSRREIEECEAAMKSNSLFSDFFLSVPYVCGANYGDTLEDLEKARKNTVDLINICKSLEGISFSAEKEEHFWVIIEIIATKIEFIKTCEEVNIKTSLFGLEHIFFDAAKSFAWREREGCINGVLKDGEQQMLEINEAALSKLYEIYENMVEECGSRNFNSAFQDDVTRKCAEEFYNCEKPDRPQKASYFVTNSPVLRQDICCIGEILDEAKSANTERLQQLMCRCTEHMEMLKAYFRILQEEDDNVFITKENVLGFMKSGGIRSVILKPEAVEVYTEIAMIHETVFFLKNSIARKVDKPRFRSLLWFDLSLLPELFRCQEKMASLSYRKDNLLKMIESSMTELQEEVNVIYDYAQNLNCSYAAQLLLRELNELSETRNLLQKSKSPISMCVDLVPYTICLNYGSTVSELECNYSQFSLLLEKLMLAERKDLGKMAHIMKIMKTIEHMKFVCSEQGKSPLPLVIYQMLKNWRKACQLRRQDVKTPLDTSIEQSRGSDTHLKRPVDVTLEDSPCSPEEKSDCSHRKKKKVTASLMTTTKIHEKEANRDLRKSGKYNFPKDKELQSSILTDNTWNKNIKVLTERSPISPFKCIPSSPNASSSSFINSDTLASQKNLANIKDFNKSSRSCQSVKENDQEYFASYDRGKCVSVSSMTFQSPQRSLEDTLSSLEKLDGDSFLLHTLNKHHDLTSDVLGNDSDLMPEYSTARRLSPKPDRDVEKSEIPKSDSPVMTELNETMELECLNCEPSFNENSERTAECSASSQNEYLGETSQMQSSVHTCRTVYPDYSCYFYQTDSNSHSVTQTYQEFKSYQMHPLTPGISTAASMVNNAQSSMFYSQTFSHFGIRESQGFNFAQAYPAHSYFNSTVAFPFSYQQQSSWYTDQALAQDPFLYPYNIGS